MYCEEKFLKIMHTIMFNIIKNVIDNSLDIIDV